MDRDDPVGAKKAAVVETPIEMKDVTKFKDSHWAAVEEDGYEQAKAIPSSTPPKMHTAEPSTPERAMSGNLNAYAHFESIVSDLPEHITSECLAALPNSDALPEGLSTEEKDRMSEFWHHTGYNLDDSIMYQKATTTQVASMWCSYLMEEHENHGLLSRINDVGEVVIVRDAIREEDNFKKDSKIALQFRRAGTSRALSASFDILKTTLFILRANLHTASSELEVNQIKSKMIKVERAMDKTEARMLHETRYLPRQYGQDYLIEGKIRMLPEDTAAIQSSVSYQVYSNAWQAFASLSDVDISDLVSHAIALTVGQATVKSPTDLRNYFMQLRDLAPEKLKAGVDAWHKLDARA